MNNLSEKDQIIITTLVQNPELTLTEVGKRVNLSNVAVRSRIKKLQDRKIIQKQILLNPRELKLEMAILLMQVPSQKQQRAILEVYKNCPRVTFIATLSGGFNIITHICLEDRSLLELLMNDCLFSTEEDTNITMTKLVIDWVSPEFWPIKPFSNVSTASITPCGRTCIDCDNYRFRTCLGCPASKHYKLNIPTK